MYEIVQPTHVNFAEAYLISLNGFVSVHAFLFLNAVSVVQSSCSKIHQLLLRVEEEEHWSPHEITRDEGSIDFFDFINYFFKSFLFLLIERFFI